MSDEYAAFSGGKLKIKKTTDGVQSSGKKKKKKDKELKKLENKISTVGTESASAEEKEAPQKPQYTKAELAYKKQQEKMKNEKIKQRAMMTHKQRVEEFNRHLDNLTEHFDIPKVSWTK